MNWRVETRSSLLRILILCTLAGILITCSTTAKADGAPQGLREKTPLDADWLFHPGDITPNDPAIAPNYQDSAWQKVHLPHDYGLDAKYDPKNARNHSYLPFEVGWYRKHLMIPESDRGKVLRLDFDGVFRDTQVWLNGQLLGKHAGGYTPFSFDISQAVRFGDDNVLAIRVDPRQFEGWWYEGAGIYRHVYLTALAPVHVAQWGTYVVSKVPDVEKGADGEANLTLQTTIQNSSSGTANCGVISEILGPDGSSLARGSKPIKPSVPARNGMWFRGPRSRTRNFGLRNRRSYTCFAPRFSKTAIRSIPRKPPSASAPLCSTRTKGSS
jgi:beta-galactosidase